MSVVLLGSTSGSVTLQEPAVAGSTVIDLPATSGTMAVLPTATSVLPQASGGTGTTTGYYGFKNRLINGLMAVDQRNNGAAQTITAGANTYTVDRWFVVATGANVTGQRVAGSGNNQYNYRLTGAASVSAISFIQRIESNNCYDLAGQTATLSVNLANSVLTTVNWQIAYAGGTDNWALATTVIASGSFTVSSTLTNFTAQISIPAAATTGLQILLNVGAQTSGTWTIGQAQLEKGSTATSFDYRPIGTELQLCQRYLPAWNTSAVNGPFAIGQAVSTTLANVILPYQVQPRVPPTGITASAAGSFYLVNSTNGLAGTYSSTAFAHSSLSALHVACTTSGGLVGGNATYLGTSTPPAQILGTGCEL